MTTYPDGTIIYTPFPDYEVEDPPGSGADTVRTTYRLGGQIIAVQTKVGAAAGVFYFTYTDHLGNIVALGQGSSVVAGSLARFDPFGNYRTTPATTVNPGVTSQGFTGHRHNNTGTNNLGLIYMNARYYMPEIGRFVSPDTIVPEPGNPQSYNRYAYSLNNPINYTDPSGHCTTNYEAGSQDLETCLSAWNSVANFLYGASFGPGGSGHFPNELVSDWLANADIGMLENLMKSYGIGYGYVYTPPQRYSVPTARRSGARQEMCQYWQSCYAPPAEYSSIGGNIFVGPRIIWDRWDNVYLYFHLSSSPGVSVTAGNIRVHDSGGTKEIESLAVDEQETAVEAFLTGASDGGCISIGVAGCVAGNSTRSYAVEGGFAFPPGLGTDVGYGIMLYNANSHTPWFWQQWFK